MKMFLMVGIAVLQVATPVPRKVPNQATGRSAHIQQKSKGNENVTASPSVQNPPAAQSGQAERNAPTEEGKPGHVIIDSIPTPDKNNWDKAYIILTALLVFIGGLTFIAVWYQAKKTAEAAKAAAESVGAINRQAGIMERQTKAGEYAAIAAQKGVEIIISKERARVSVEVGMFTIGHPNDPPDVSGVSYTVSCHGTTPANVIRTSIEIALKTPKNTAAFQSDGPMNLPAVLTPNNRGLGCITHLVGVAGTDAQSRFMKGDLYAYCHGWIIYKDIFSSAWVYEFTYMKTHDKQWMGGGRENTCEDDEEDHSDTSD